VKQQAQHEGVCNTHATSWMYIIPYPSRIS